ncbi:MAG: amidohydrolase [Gemmatimonadetes bacterium]|nr:amidohydrolase [Gemmatimonadota bacterium]
MRTLELPRSDATRRMVDLRRTFHRRPELAFEEAETARTVIGELERLGIDYRYDGVGSAVVGRLSGPPGSPVVALRAEMDALPAIEKTGLPFASEIEGRMHACGHDAHMAMVLGAAARHCDDPPPGTVVYLFQPAEERGGGARVPLESGALDDVDAIFAGHVTHHYRLGEIMVTRGTVTAHSDGFRIRVCGEGGHGARPHEAVDAVIVVGMLIGSLQSLVTREIDPVHPSVVTIGRIEAGTASNVIAEEAVLEGTIRTTLPEVREHIHRGLERLCRAAAELHRAEVSVDIRSGYPPVVNSDREAEVAAAAAAEVIGREHIVVQEYPSMGSEDFGFLLQEIPGCYVRFGTRGDDDHYIPLHSPHFTVDESVLPIGARYFDTVVRHAIARIGEEG